MNYRVIPSKKNAYNHNRGLLIYHVQTKQKWWHRWRYLLNKKGVAKVWYSQTGAQSYINIKMSKEKK